MNLKDKKILVTGGAGFIGSHIVDKLVDQGAKITVIDNLSTGNIKNIEPHLDKIEFINGDITNYLDTDKVCKDKEIVFHLAAKTSVPESEIETKLYHEVNVTGTINLLEAAKKNNVKKFIFSSSSAVYGNNEYCSEDDSCNPTSIYGITKYICEVYCKHYSKYFDTACLRYFNVYGARQVETGENAGVVAKFKNMMRSNSKIKIFGNGMQTRDFVPVEFVADANIMATRVTGFEAVNIASGKSITLIELFSELKKTFPEYNLEPEFMPARSGDILNSKADCKKMKAMLK